jgi:hypothetical protein
VYRIDQGTEKRRGPTRAVEPLKNKKKKIHAQQDSNLEDDYAQYVSHISELSLL